MKRDDYWKFLAAAKEQLPPEYMLLSPQLQEGCHDMLIRVVNSRGIRFDEAHLAKYHGCPYVVGIDIFPLDYLPEREEDRRAQCEMIKSVLLIPQLIEQNAIGKEELTGILVQLKQAYGVTFSGELSIAQQLYRLGEQLCGLYGAGDGHELTCMLNYVNGREYRLCEEWYSEAVMLPFENMMIPVPVGYEQVLEAEYKDWKKVVRGGGSHDYPFFKSQENTLRAYAADNGTDLPPVVSDSLRERVHDDDKTPVLLKGMNYKEIREKGYYYVDKTLFIKELSDNPHRVMLFCMPPQSGKTTLLYMSACFFLPEADENGQRISNKQLFAGTKLMKAGDDCLSRQEQYPIMHFHFNRQKRFVYEEIKAAWEEELFNHFKYYQFVLRGEALSENLKGEYKTILGKGRAEVSEIRFLMECLFQYYGKKSVVILEDYDVLLKNISGEEERQRVLLFIRQVMQEFFCKNEWQELGIVMAGDAAESEFLFEGVEDMHIVTPESQEFAPYFAYTAEELSAMLDYYNIQEKAGWFESALLKNKTLYHPWKVNNLIVNIRNGAEKPELPD